MSDEKDVERMLAQLLETELANTCGQESKQSYFDMHKDRFADILDICRNYVPDRSVRVLDVGRSELTAYLLNFYQDVYTLGLDLSIDDGGHRERSKMETAPHIIYDLLNARVFSSWPASGPFDLIVFSEVIEHLCVAPEFVFAFLNSLLADDGVLICTTPNAADISKRLRLALGQNPYERLRLYSINPGHLREYTRQELCAIAQSVGLRCISHSYLNWMQSRGKSRVKAFTAKLLRSYPPFRPFQLCVLSKRRDVLLSQ